MLCKVMAQKLPTCTFLFLLILSLSLFSHSLNFFFLNTWDGTPIQVSGQRESLIIAAAAAAATTPAGTDGSPMQLHTPPPPHTTTTQACHGMTWPGMAWLWPIRIKSGMYADFACKLPYLTLPIEYLANERPT